MRYIKGMPGHGESLENGDFNLDLTKVLNSLILCQREGQREKVRSPETMKCLTPGHTALRF